MSSTLCLIWILPSVQLQLTSNRVLTETSAGCCVTLNSNNMSGFFASRPSCLISFSRAGIANSRRERDSPTSTCWSRCCRNSSALWCLFAGLRANFVRKWAHLGATGFHHWCLAAKETRLSKLWTLVGGRRLWLDNCSAARSGFGALTSDIVSTSSSEKELRQFPRWDGWRAEGQNEWGLQGPPPSAWFLTRSAWTRFFFFARQDNGGCHEATKRRSNSCPVCQKERNTCSQATQKEFLSRRLQSVPKKPEGPLPDSPQIFVFE